MPQISIRGLDPDIEAAIRCKARQSGKSINRVILDMIHQQAGLNKKGAKPAAYSLKKLAGGWSRQEAAEFSAAIAFFRQIDEEMWA